MGEVSEDPGSAVRVVSIGAGPAAVMLLERFAANHLRDTPGLPVEYVLVDPYEPGAGRIWRRDQSPLLKLNSMREDVTMFTDDSCSIAGPVSPGPSLSEWVTAVREGRIPEPSWADDRLRAEIANADDRDFPTRRLGGAYLSWTYDEVRRRADPALSIRWIADAAVEVEDLAPPASADRPGRGRHAVRLASGERLDADIVVHVLGHNGSDTSGESIGLGEFAERHGLAYVGPAFTADLDFSWLAPGSTVIVRGLGLAAVDLTVMLAEGRGGRFEPDGEGRLRYLPSGREPRLLLGSRRGVPYRSKITSRVAGDPVRLEYLDAAAVARLSEARGTLDFFADVWPLVEREMLTGYYRELFTAYPERVLGEWPAFREALRCILAEPGAGPESSELAELIAASVPDPDDRFELAPFDRPLAHPSPGADADTVSGRVVAHIRQDLRQRTSPDRSATQALFLTALYSSLAISEIPSESWNETSLTRTLRRDWANYFSYVASGPPDSRLRELLALAEAGIIDFFGGEVVLETDEERGVFRASGTAVTPTGAATASVEATTLIDAWLPDSWASISDNALLRRLVAEGRVRERAGKIVVDDGGRVPGSTGYFALGPFTSQVQAGAFTRPGIDALPLRRHDRIARNLLATARELRDPAARSAGVAA